MAKGIIEYAGYRAPRTTNWDKVLGEVGEDVTGAVTKREKQREEDFKIQQETESAINDFSTGVSQDFSDYVSRGVEANRDLMMKYTKMLRSNEINSTQYKRLMNRVNSDWQQFGQFSKDFETRLAEMEKRRQAIPPESSVIETWNGEKIASAADFKNKQLVPNASSGGLYSISYKDGKPVKNEIIHMNELNNFRAQLVDRVDINKTIGAVTSKAGNFKLAIGDAPIRSIEGISSRLAEADPSGRMLTEYNNLINGIYDMVLTGPPNRVASALADNALNSKGQGYFVYQEGDLEKGGRFEGKKAEDGIKMVQQSDGSWGGELTEKQRELLKKKAKEIADVQLGFKEAYMAKERDFLEETKIEAAADIKKAEIAASAKSKGKGFGETEEDQVEIYRNTNAVATGEQISQLNGLQYGSSNIENARITGNGRHIVFDKMNKDGKKTGVSRIEVTEKDGSPKNRELVGRILYGNEKQGPFKVQDAYKKGRNLVSEEERLEIETVKPGEYNKLAPFYAELEKGTEEEKLNRTEKRDKLADIMVNNFKLSAEKTVDGEKFIEKSDPRYKFLGGLADSLGYEDFNLDDLKIVITDSPSLVTGGKQKLTYNGVESLEFDLDPNDGYSNDDEPTKIDNIINIVSDFLLESQEKSAGENTGTESQAETTIVNMG